MKRLLKSKLSESIGCRLRAARKAADYKSARRFAQTHQIPASTYAQHETGKRALNIETILYYSDLLKLHANWSLSQPLKSHKKQRIRDQK